MAPGGKGANQAAAAAKAGAEVRFVGHVGDDAYGPVVRGLLVEAGVDCEQLAVAHGPTAIAVIGVDEGGENAIIVASGANLDTAAAQVPDALLGPGATVLCQNEIRPQETFAALTRAKRRGAHRAQHGAGRPCPPEVLKALDVLVVNEIEAETVAGGTGGRPRPGPRTRRPPRPHLRRHPGRRRLHRGHRRPRAGACRCCRSHRSTRPAPATPSWACSPLGSTAAPLVEACAPPASPPPAAGSCTPVSPL